MSDNNTLWIIVAAVVALVVVRIIARVMEGGGVLEVPDADLRALANLAAAMRPPHPFALA